MRSTIKGRPPQTFLHPEEKWMFGQSHPGEQGHIFYYQFFDPDNNAFANLSIFEFNPATFALSRRIFASRAVWDEQTETWRFHNGWVRNIDGNNAEYSEFKNTSFAEIHEDPGYFKKENWQSQEMNFGQLDSYIRDLRQSGFDTMRLRVALWHKLAYPLIADGHVCAGNSLCALHGASRFAYGNCGRHLGSSRLLGGRWPVRRHGQCQLPSGGAGGVVSRRAIWPYRWLSAAADADLRPCA